MFGDLNLVNYWFCVTNEDNWNIIKLKHVWGVPKRGRRYVLDVEIGDFLVFYIIPKKIGGIFRAASEPFESEERIFSWIDYGKDEVFPFRVKIEPVLVPEKALPFDRLIEKLSFSKGLKRWSIKLRRAMFKISEEDFNTIKTYVSG